MTDEQHDRTPDTAPAVTYCTRKPRVGERVSEVRLAACEACGHAVVLHIGAHHCPVCEMVDLNAQKRASLEANAQPGTVIPISVRMAAAGKAAAEALADGLIHRHKQQTYGGS